MHPGALFPDIGIFDQVGIEPHSFGHFLHGFPNLPMRATCNDDSIEAMLSNPSFNQIEIFRKAGQTDLFHMDHLFGFPFFGPIYSPNSNVSVAVPAYSGIDAQNKLGRYLNGIYHPLRINEVAERMHFKGVRPGRPFEIGPYRVEGIRLEHPGGATGYRIECGGKTLIYEFSNNPGHPYEAYGKSKWQMIVDLWKKGQATRGRKP